MSTKDQQIDENLADLAMHLSGARAEVVRLTGLSGVFLDLRADIEAALRDVNQAIDDRLQAVEAKAIAGETEYSHMLTSCIASTAL